MNDAGPEADEAWWLEGESIVALMSRRGWRWDLPDGVARAPGPLLVSATRFSGSPHGPFLELAVAEPARLGARFGWCRTLVVVDRPDVQRESTRWGLPAMLGRLEWSADDEIRKLSWLDRDLQVTGRVRRLALPWAISQRSLQRRGGDNVVVPSRSRGLAHTCLVRIDLVGDDAAAPPRRSSGRGALRRAPRRGAHRAAPTLATRARAHGRAPAAATQRPPRAGPLRAHLVGRLRRPPVGARRRQQAAVSGRWRSAWARGRRGAATGRGGAARAAGPRRTSRPPRGAGSPRG